ncbi:MAG TPA: Uma2 family endonuclease [Thermomicrobiales bacterium]|nr:Uma2 family endonuclease [Thermomicrobiales bacterium]
MATTTKLLTADDLEQMGAAGEELELYYGVPHERGEMSGRHGEVGAAILFAVGTLTFDQDLGRLYTSDTQFVLSQNPDVIVKPDVAFVRSERLPSEQERMGIMRLAPDLAVEVVSPTDRYVAVLAKMDLYREAGVPLVWLAEPQQRTVTVYSSGSEPRILTEADTLDGGDVLPGFRLPVAQIFR